MATIDPALHTWLEEHEQLAQDVDLWFREATSRFAAPSGVGCRSVAFYMVEFRHRVDDKKPDHRKQAIKYGKLFLKHIAFERREIEAMVSLASRGRPLGDWFEEYKETLCRINETRRHIEAILPAISPSRDAKPDPIRLLASVAQETWAGANDGRAPRSMAPDDPLCRFLVKALAAIRLDRSPAEISEVLRGRRRKSR
jgi:hypothetical protein